MVKDNQISLGGCNHRTDFVDLAFASKGFWIRALPPPSDFSHNRATGRLCQQTYFFQLIFEIELAKVKLNDHRTFTGGGSFNHGLYWKKKGWTRQ